MLKTAQYILLNCLRHPSIMYFFILPIYVPIRTLAEYINQYQAVFQNTASRFSFFISSVLIGAFVSIIIYFVISSIVNSYRKDKSDQAITSIGFLCPILLLITTYLLLNDHIQIEVKYGVMGVHFFLIRYLTNYVVLKTKTFKMKQIADDQMSMANNIIHLNINFLGIITNALFVVFLAKNLTLLFLETMLIIGCIYFYIGYFKHIKVESLKSLILPVCIFFIGISLSSLISFIMLLSPMTVYLSIITMFIYLTLKLLKKTNSSHVYQYITGSFNYACLLFPIISSLIIFLLHGHKTQQVYKFIYSFEAPISAVVAIFFTILLTKKKIKTDDYSLTKNTFFYGFISISNLCLIWILTCDQYFIFIITCSLFFLSYSLIEYVIQFNLIQILLNNQYDTKTTTLFNIYFTLIVMGITPVIFLFFQNLITQILHYDFYQALPIGMSLLFLLSFIINLFGMRFLAPNTSRSTLSLNS
ncbi:hypothetical protein L3V79_00655 [Thiotrichales bacterium 19S9-12]|nr:hypothetical protein [Thiotrichales bacterium 19S9-11]MCF6810871.1 hypothetical protein [Thiotrichales bacterium 19S9-12]